MFSEEHYDNDNPRDPLGEFAPLDLAVGWGIMGKMNIRDEVSISQSRRRYYWWGSARDIPMESIQKIGASSANWHLIPANKFVVNRC